MSALKQEVQEVIEQAMNAIGVVTLEKASEITKVPLSTLRAWVQTGRLASTKNGKLRYVELAQAQKIADRTTRRQRGGKPREVVREVVVREEKIDRVSLARDIAQDVLQILRHSIDQQQEGKKPDAPPSLGVRL